MIFKRNLIVLSAMLLTAFLLHIIIYKFNFKIELISNSLFILSVLSLFPSLIVVTNAFTVFQGINYAMRSLLSSKFKENYSSFREFKEEKSKKVKSNIFNIIFFWSIAFFAVSLLLAVI